MRRKNTGFSNPLHVRVVGFMPNRGQKSIRIGFEGDPAIDSATIESDPRALKEEYELAGLSHLGLVGLAFGGITAVTSFTSCL